MSSQREGKRPREDDPETSKTVQERLTGIIKEIDDTKGEQDVSLALQYLSTGQELLTAAVKLVRGPFTCLISNSQRFVFQPQRKSFRALRHADISALGIEEGNLVFDAPAVGELAAHLMLDARTQTEIRLLRDGLLDVFAGVNLQVSHL